MILADCMPPVRAGKYQGIDIPRSPRVRSLTDSYDGDAVQPDNDHGDGSDCSIGESELSHRSMLSHDKSRSQIQ